MDIARHIFCLALDFWHARGNSEVWEKQGDKNRVCWWFGGFSSRIIIVTGGVSNSKTDIVDAGSFALPELTAFKPSFSDHTTQNTQVKEIMIVASGRLHELRLLHLSSSNRFPSEMAAIRSLMGVSDLITRYSSSFRKLIASTVRELLDAFWVSEPDGPAHLLSKKHHFARSWKLA